METAMMTLSQIAADRDLVNEIDWEMTPEEAVRLYLEWGNNWARGNYVIRSKDDYSYYFVVNTWKEKPVIFLIKRNSDAADELAKIDLPEDMAERFLESVSHHKGVYPVEGEVRQWLERELQLQD